MSFTIKKVQRIYVDLIDLTHQSVKEIEEKDVNVEIKEGDTITLNLDNLELTVTPKKNG